MNKYIVMYRVPVETMQEWMKTTPPEEIKAQSEKMGTDMQAWMTKHAASIVDKGMPMGKTKRVTAAGVEDTRNDLNYFQIIEAESHDAAVEMVKDNPHLSIPTSFLDVMEVPHMGM